MKNKNLNLLVAIFAVIFLWSCEKDDNTEPEGEWTLSQPILTEVNGGNKLVLDESNPLSEIEFSWEAAVSSAGYNVLYNVTIESANAGTILSFQSLDGGKSTTASVTTYALNEALYMAGYMANTDIELQWSVLATCQSKETNGSSSFRVVRYDDDQLYLSGAGTEVGDDVGSAIQMKRLMNAAGEKLNLYEIHTHLTANESFMIYNGRSENAVAYGVDGDGNLVNGGAAITVEEEGIYRVNIDFDAMSISFFKINTLAIIGDALEGSWDVEEVLEYKGMGVWQADISFVRPGSFIFRANNDWQGIIKLINNTENQVVLEDFGNENGYEFDNFQQSEAGLYSLTLTLNGDEYTLEQEKAPEDRMYLMVNNADNFELVMIADGKFATTNYLPLQATDEITINTKADGSGTSYSISDIIGEGEGDKVEGVSVLSEGSASFSTSLDQAFGFVIDLNTNELTWYFYNIKLFHWNDDVEGGWDARTENFMTYTHPYIFTVNVDLEAEFETKFFAPWDIQFGAGENDDPTALVGSATNSGDAVNISNITTSGNYMVTLNISADYATANYEFVIQ